MSRRSLSLIVFALACATPAAASAAGTGPCLDGGGGPTCHYWTAKVVSVNDGDTVYADVGGDGSHRVESVRFSSVQAMEQHTYSSHPSRRTGECHAVEATARAEQLIRASHWRVRLSAQDPASRAGDRLRRFVAVRRGGRWRDLGAILMREGHTLWMPAVVETSWNRRYATLEQEAKRARVGLWNPTHCGVGPSQHAVLKMWVNWDAPGRDAPDNEWMKIFNPGTTAVALGGWWVRDSMLRRLTFPNGTVLPAGETITVHTGAGPQSPYDFYWNYGFTIFENPGDPRDLGDGAYLFDPRGDLRASFVYPCLVACADPNQGAVELTTQVRRRDNVRVHNVSDHAIDLYGYRLAKRGNAYDFGPGTVLQPGETFQVDETLADHGDAVRLTTFDGITIACVAWGDSAC